MSRRKDRLPGRIISFVFLLIVAAFACLLIYTDLLPVKYIAVIVGVLLLYLVIVALLVLKLRHKVRFWIGTVMAVLMTVLLGFGSAYIYKTIHTLDNISGVNTVVSQINVYVRTDDPADSVSDASDYVFGILSELDRENTDHTIEQIQLETGKEIAVQEYQSLTELADSIIRENTDAIILNPAYIDVLTSMSGYSKIEAMIREISTKKVEKLVERTDPQPAVDAATGEVDKDDSVITILISGIDTRNSYLVANSLSDVNIIATINTKTRQVLLVSTPRDFFVPLSISGGVPDKLTHAGIYGVNVCMDTLAMLYDIDINYYFRLNFAGFVNIIDALGGVTVHSDYDFTAGSYHYSVGDNYLNGEQALAFARERHAFSSGDRQRGKHQMEVIRAVLNKVMSPDLLKNYTSLMDSLKGCFETSVPYDLIAKVVRKQLDEGGSWNIVSYSADGTGDNQKPYSMSTTAYVMIPDQTTVDKAKDLMQRVRDGETITEEMLVQ